MSARFNRRSLLAWGLSPMAARTAWAATYPTRPVQLVVPHAPAGFVDIVGRLFTEPISAGLGQPVVVDNKPGAAGNIGTAFVAKSAPDGHTLLLGFDGTLVINPLIYASTGFQTLRDFTPVIKLVEAGLVLVAHPGGAARNLRELIALRKNASGPPLAFATSGTGSTPHIAGELLARQSGVRLEHVPYRGGGPAMADVVAGHVPLAITTVATASAYLKGGRVIALGVTSAKRSSALPDVPTFQESGVSGFAVNSWVGVFAPAMTPRDVVARLQKEFFMALSRPEMREKLQQLGLDAAGSNPQEFSRQIQADLERYARITKEAKITVDG